MKKNRFGSQDKELSSVESEATEGYLREWQQAIEMWVQISGENLKLGM